MTGREDLSVGGLPSGSDLLVAIGKIDTLKSLLNLMDSVVTVQRGECSSFG